MSLPASFAAGGFVPPDAIRGKKRRRLMLGSDGLPDSGKTEFVLSIPGPGIILAVDRGYEAMLDNPNPPEARRDDYGFNVIRVPLAGTATDGKVPQEFFKEFWFAFLKKLREALDNKDANVVCIDGDSDTWELQRLAAFGKLTQIPSIMYTGVNAARRVMYSRCFDSGKTIVATNKTKKHYADKIVDGQVVISDTGKPVREWDGTYERQGFDDQEYLWQVQLHHMSRKSKNGMEFGIRVIKCKADRDMEGLEIWGADCNYYGLVTNLYPHIDPREWGFAA